LPGYTLLVAANLLGNIVGRIRQVPGSTCNLKLVKLRIIFAVTHEDITKVNNFC
jgi:hypothetical protein